MFRFYPVHLPVFRQVFSRPETVTGMTGRWRLDYDQKVLDRKVYLTNMDHCGPCGMVEATSNATSKATPDSPETHGIHDDLLTYYVM